MALITYDCEMCGTRVTRRRSPSTVRVPPKFCSQRCNAARKTELARGTQPNHSFNCQHCGRVVVVYRSPAQARRQPPRFCSLRCLGAAQRGEHNPSFTGGRYTDSNGYVLVLAPQHRLADCRGYVYEHRLIAEQKIGRDLGPDEVVHHVNGVKSDNQPENLHVMASQSEHLRLHAEART